MVSLIDIAPLNETVRVQGQDVSVVGISSLGLAHLLKHFPELRALIVGRSVDISAELLMDVAPRAISAIIAAGTGFPGNANAEKVADSLPVGEQLELLSVILKLTMPDGVDPLVEKLGRLVATLGVSGVGGKAPAGSSPKRSKS